MRYLDKPQLRSLLEAARSENPKWHLLILLAYAHGLRSTEAVNVWIGPTSARIPVIKRGKAATIPAPYVESNTLIVQRLKGSELTRQPLLASSDTLFDEVTLLGACGAGPLFSGYTRHSFNNILRRYGRLGVIPRFLAHPHVLKRSLGKHMVAGAGLENTSVYLGHRNWNSTKAYTAPDDTSAAQAMKSAIFDAA